jgi:hypothetical protein
VLPSLFYHRARNQAGQEREQMLVITKDLGKVPL